MRKTGLNRYFYDSSVDYDAIAVDYVLDMRNYWEMFYKWILVQIKRLSK